MTMIAVICDEVRREQGLVATYGTKVCVANLRSDNHAGCHSLRSRRFATPLYKQPLAFVRKFNTGRME